MRSRNLVLLLAVLGGIAVLLLLMSDGSNEDRRHTSRRDACGEEQTQPSNSDPDNDTSDGTSGDRTDSGTTDDNDSESKDKPRIVLSGVLRYEDGSPVPAAVLFLSGDRKTQAVTGSDGSFKIASATAKSGNHDLIMKGVGDYDSIAISRFRLKVDVPKTVEVTIAKGLEWSGTVLSEDTREPVSAIVVLNRGGAAMVKGWQGSTCIAICDKSGKFRFTHIPVAQYTAMIRARGYRSQTLQLGESSFESSAEIVLRAASDLRVRLKGMIPAWTKIPLLITVRSAGADGRLDGKYHEAHHKKGEGPWTIPVPPAGRYEVELRAPKHLDFPRMTKSLEVTEEPPAELEFEIDEGARIAGTVSRPDGAAAPSVRLRWGPNDAETTADSEGRFAFPHVPNGSGTIQLWNGVFWVALESLEVPRNGQLDAQLRTHGTSSIRGRCESDRKPPRKSVRLMVRGTHGKLLGSGYANKDGSFEILWLGAGTYAISIEPSDGTPVTREVSVDGHGDRDIGTIELSAFPTVPVVIEKNPADLVVPDRLTVVVLPDGHVGWIHKTKDGKWHLGGVAEGTHSVLIRGDGLESERHSITVRAGQADPIRVRLRAKE
ncbi:MAG: hypothetical protein AAF488_04010 [Planctomycetota bacterium]